ncbi:MAG: hypothetical protein Ct9H90mP18_09230 [Gammaproteobacteria bacterium]|nr:MAG: hypothetical protein Ct9H90mP18_09230 [Gammaproteobacteria bacterium]
MSISTVPVFSLSELITRARYMYNLYWLNSPLSKIRYKSLLIETLSSLKSNNNNLITKERVTKKTKTFRFPK